MAESIVSAVLTSFPQPLILKPASNPRTSLFLRKPVYLAVSSFPKSPTPTPESSPSSFSYTAVHSLSSPPSSPFSPVYHNHVAALVAKANIVAFSVNYRKAPEHPLPMAYDDAWDALQWAISHSGGDGPEEWLNHHADFRRVFLSGDSAGGNIAHNIVVRAGNAGISGGSRIVGMVLISPFFNDDGGLQKMLDMIFPTNSGPKDPRLNPGADTKLGKLGCEKVLILVAEKDMLKKQGWSYYEALKKSAWGGSVEIVETEDEGHAFHLFNPASDKALALMDKTVAFFNHN